MRSPAAWGAWRSPCGSDLGTQEQDRDFRKTGELQGLPLAVRLADFSLCPLGDTLLHHLSSKRHHLDPIYLWSLKIPF